MKDVKLLNDLTHEMRNFVQVYKHASKEIYNRIPKVENIITALANEHIKHSFYCPIRKPDGSPADIRNDSEGGGKFGDSRDGGKRSHIGTDYEGYEIGQPVFMPIKNAIISRQLYVYRNDMRLSGVEIKNDDRILKLFYVEVNPDLIGKNVEQRELIGKLQNIWVRHSKKMKLHLHVQRNTKIDENCF